jgi:hypothetical protein
MRLCFLFIFPLIAPLAGIEAIEYLHPSPGSILIPKETVIITRFKDILPDQISNKSSFIQVTGDKSGQVSGSIVMSSDKRTLIFYADRDYMPGEVVTVKILPNSEGKILLEKTYQFEISQTQRTPRKKREYIESQKTIQITSDNVSLQKPTAAPRVINGVSVPSDFPELDIHVFDNPFQENMFITTIEPFYSIIYDYQGNPLYYLRKEHEMMDFKLQPDGRLTAWEADPGCPFALDSTYIFVDRFHAPEGYWCDDHELQVLPNGEYYIIVSDERQMDLTQWGGRPDAWVTGNHVAHMDANHNLIWIWRSWDHLDEIEVIDGVGGLISIDDDFRIDYIHMNAIDFDIDGNIVVSNRHLSEITKINRQTGDIMWRLGGKKDHFTWTNDDDRLSYQHSVRVLPNGHYTIFDNGNYHIPHFSRALEVELDTVNWTATKVWEFRDTPDVESWAMGNVQRLVNGNTLINWSLENPVITEVRPNGEKSFEASIYPHPAVYRAFKIDWEGKARIPNLIIEPQADNITLFFNKFGDYDVDYYNIYGGQQTNPTDILATSSDPFVQLSDLENGNTYYFRVTAVNTSGNESDYSDQKSIYVNIVPPGTNFVSNGDFSNGIDFWGWDLDNDAVASWEINQDDEFQVTISNAGRDLDDIQLAQFDIPLIQGTTYMLEFDARAIDFPRVIEIELKEGRRNFSRMGLTYITTTMEHYSHEFEMEEEFEPNSQIVINVGGSDIGIAIDNVSLKVPVTSVENPNEKIPVKYQLINNYPNPFNPKTVINYELPITNEVDLSVFNVLGQKVTTLVDQQKQPGYYQVEWDATDYASGIYYYRIQAGDFQDVKKMILLR